MKQLVALITSDMHAADGGKDDPFKPLADRWEQELFELADQVVEAEQRSLIVLNGDNIDLWNAGNALRTAATAKMLQNLAGLLCPQASDQVHLLLGNHDRDLIKYRALLPVRLTLHKRLILPLEGFGVTLITHGDEWDPVNGWFPVIGRTAARFAQWTGNFWPAAERWMGSLGGKIQQGGRYGTAGDMMDRIRDYLCNSAGLDSAIVSHSHQADQCELVNAHIVRYWNTGTWQKDGWLRLWSDGSWDRWKLS